MACLTTLAVAGCSSHDKKTEQSSQQSTDQNQAATLSYTLGYQMGKQVAEQQVFTPNSKKMTQGLGDAMDGTKPEYSKKEIKASMADFQAKLQAQMKEKVQKDAEKNEKASKAFMKAVANIDGIQKVSDGIYIQTITKGDGATPKNDGSSVSVTYKGSTPAAEFAKDKEKALAKMTGKSDHGDNTPTVVGHIFDQSEKPISFQLDQVIPCWTQALQHVKKGATVILYCSPDQAYGKMAPPQIGPNQALEFKVTVTDVNNQDD